MSLPLFLHPNLAIPASTVSYLPYIAESRAKQNMFTRQSPHRMKGLHERAPVETVMSSNWMEVVELDSARVGSVVFGKSAVRNRYGEKVRGNRDALDWIHRKATEFPTNEESVAKLHRLTRGQDWDAGKYEEPEGDFIESHVDGRWRLRFKSEGTIDTPKAMENLTAVFAHSLRQHRVSGGTVRRFQSRLPVYSSLSSWQWPGIAPPSLLQSFQAGLELGRHIRLERQFGLTKDRYYETLDQNPQSRHECKHYRWSYINYMLHMFKQVFGQFESLPGNFDYDKGQKTILVFSAIKQQNADFRIADNQRTYPDVSLP